MNEKLEKQKKLENIKSILKSEFVGLDDIIDDIMTAISPWYITPEIINRPVVISLWGMTGTGKSSIVKRITELLGLKGKSIFFDCGEESNSAYSGSIVDKIDDIFSSGDSDSEAMQDYMKDLVFVFDEFQYARTLDESGSELSKSQLRPIWNIIDSGIINNSCSYRYFTYHVVDRLKWFENVLDACPDLRIEPGLIVTNKKQIQTLKDNDISLSDNIPGDKEDSEDIDKVFLLEKEFKKILKSKLGLVENGKDMFKSIIESKDINELYDKLKEACKIILAPRVIDCSKSLVFVLGNLDEAYTVGVNLSPDLDADIFNEMTSKVTVTDIKNSLKSRFRLEQISRLGNNLIKYPTLKKKDFEKIIEKELSRVNNEFKGISGITIDQTDNFKRLIYSEGVTPAQGVRPLLSTIGTIFTPLLSKILMVSGEEKHIIIDMAETDNIEAQLRKPSTKIAIKDKSGKVLSEEEVKLPLGELRNPENCETRYIRSVHEIGHAIMMAYTTGELPQDIISVSSEDSGFCTTWNPEKQSIPSKHDIDSSVMISLGGYLSERVIYKDQNLCLFGSGSDLSSAWSEFSRIAYKGGYFYPVTFSSNTENTNDGVPSGIMDDFGTRVNDGGRVTYSLNKQIRMYFQDLIENTEYILKQETDLIVQSSLILGEKGRIGKEEFKNLIEKYGKNLTLDHMKDVRLAFSPNTYKETLLLIKAGIDKK